MPDHPLSVEASAPKTLLTYLSASIACAITATACGTSSMASTRTATPVASATTSAPANNGTTISVANTKIGHILVNGSGRTVYLFQADKGTTSTCYGACAMAWPPVTTAGTPRSANGASAALLGTTRRTDGTNQVTYGGHPLYYFIGDRKPGDMAGQGLNQFGAKWYVVAPNGKKVDTG